MRRERQVAIRGRIMVASTAVRMLRQKDAVVISPEKQALLDQATRRPWRADTNEGCKRICGAKAGTHKQAQYAEVAYTVGRNESEDRANAVLVVAAVNDYERLLTVEAERDTLAKNLDKVSGVVDTFAVQFNRVSDERDTLKEALERIVDENYLRGSHDDGWQGMCARQGRLAREVLAALSSPVAEEEGARDA